MIPWITLLLNLSSTNERLKALTGLLDVLILLNHHDKPKEKVMSLNATQSPSFANIFGTAAQRPAEEQREKAQLWLNIGVVVGVNEKGEDIFINLPVGIPLDTMKALEVKGQNKDWNAFTVNRNKLLEHFQKQGASMEPGAETTIEGLTVKIKRVAPAASVDAEQIGDFANVISFK